MRRVEVWFTNGLFRAYPNVETNTIKEEDGKLTFTFGEHKHQAVINLDNVNFIEAFDE